MQISARRALSPIVSLALALGALSVLTNVDATRAAASSQPSDDRTIAHVLNRIGFGARPGDLEKVRVVGVMNYIDQQLHPEKVDDSALDARLRDLKTLTMSTDAIARQYFLPALMERRDLKREEASQDPAGPAGKGAPPKDTDEPRPRRPTEAMRKAREVIAELTEQKLLRAVGSERQLQEVLVDFWFNHFNVFAGKGPDRMMLTAYERDTIRPHVLGTFRDLLGATAKSPAMLFYLDNWLSSDPAGPHLDRANMPSSSGGVSPFGFRRPGRGPNRELRRPAQPAGRQKRSGLNENYARELMELHTLGVDAGYTQQDIVEVARAFTGWTIRDPRQGGGFQFDLRLHDDGEKHVLGHTIKAGGGEKDGEQVLDILAHHPSTAHFIATKLARRFVSDTPPAALVERATARFLQTDGNLREVVRTIITSPEFFSKDAYRSKVKSPLEFVTSAVRTSGARIERAFGVGRALQQLGMQLYFCQPPTGYADTADAWVNTGGLVNRMNFALALVNNRVPGTSLDLAALTRLGRNAGTEELAGARDRLVHAILQGDASEATAATLRKATDATQLAALMLGAPEFQRK